MTLKRFKEEYIRVENVPIIKKVIDYAPIIVDKRGEVHYWDGLNWQKDSFENFELKNACLFTYDHEKDRDGNIVWATKAEMEWMKKQYIDEKVKELYQIYMTP